MAVTDAMLGLTLAVVLLYITMYNHKKRVWRMVGCVAIIVVTGALGAVEDSLVMYSVFLVNLMVCGLRLINDVSMIVQKGKKRKSWF